MKPELTDSYIIDEALDDYAFGEAVVREVSRAMDWSSLFKWYDVNWHEGRYRVGALWQAIRVFPLCQQWEWFHGNEKAVDHGAFITFEGWGASANDPMRLVVINDDDRKESSNED